jgi:hypothetical protein
MMVERENGTQPGARRRRTDMSEYQAGAVGRGFTRMEPVSDDDGGEVRIYESSAACAPHIWLAIEVPGVYGAERTHAHLTLEQAEQVESRLRWLRENHSQIR